MGTSAYHPSDGKRLYLQLRECLGHRYTPEARSIKPRLSAANGVFIYYKYKKRTKKRLD